MKDKYDVEAQILPEDGEEEIWKPAPGFEDRYDVSSFGNVRFRETGRLRKIRQDNCGYPCLCLRRGLDYKVCFVYIHRLVCEAFYGPPTEEEKVCDHRDHCIVNNYYKNLHWTDYSGNAKNHKPKRSFGIKTNKTPIVFVDLDGRFQQRFDNIVQASELTGLSLIQIQHNLQGRRRPFKNGYFLTEAAYLSQFDK